MSRRKPLEIKKSILELLRKYGEMSFRQLESKVNTNYQTIKNQVGELEFFEKVEVVKQKRNDKNGRPFRSVRLKK